jgi:hypothetical protein
MKKKSTQKPVTKSSRKARGAARKVRIQSGAKNLSKQAGLIPVLKFHERLGLAGLLDRAVAQKRGASAVYTLCDALLLTIVGLIGGARSLRQVVRLWSDEVLRVCGGWLRIPDDSTLGRLFKEVRAGQVGQLEAVIHQLRSRVWRLALRAGSATVGAQRVLWIDVDSTVKTVYGDQEGAAKGYNPEKRGAKSYHPLLAFCTATQELLQGWLRTGSAYTSNGVVAFMQQLLAHLPNRVRVVFRGDSGFFVGELLTLLEARGQGYLIKVKLKNLTTLLARKAWTAVPGQAGWEYCEFLYACGGWGRLRRFVAVRLDTRIDPSRAAKAAEDGYVYFCYVTSEPFTPWQAHQSYGERATCETWIEEAKNQLGLAHLKTDTFLANAALFQCAILAYNTLQWMALVSGQATLMQWEITTLRRELIQVAGKLLTGGRQLHLRIPHPSLYRPAWEAWWALADEPT